MARTRGNLAYSGPGAEPVRKRPDVAARRVVTPLFPSAENPRTEARSRALQRGVTRRRLRNILAALLCVVAISGVFAILLYKQSQIMAAQFAITEMEIRIEKLAQEKAMLDEEIMKKLDLSRVRLLAIERLGMQETGRNKTVSVGAISADMVILNAAGSSGPQQDDPLKLAAILGNLEGFFKKLK
jgi:hypothetical protein